MPRPEIIAELAQGYEGNPKLAQLLVQGALNAEADAVKFQYVLADELATPEYEHYALFRQLEMSDETWKSLVNRAREHGKRFYLDIFGFESLEAARVLGADGVKIHATDFENHRLVARAVEQFDHVMIGIAGVSSVEIQSFIQRHGLAEKQNVLFMYGFQAEPTPIEANHLDRLRKMTEKFPAFRFGFMDHADGQTQEGMLLSLMALPLGVSCIEKHLTLDHLLAIEDHVSGLTPSRFKEFVTTIRHYERAIGTSAEPSEDEKAYRRKVQKVVVANRPLDPNNPLSLEDISLKRTGAVREGCITDLEKVVDKKLSAPVSLHQPITLEDLQS